jgi:hypothetical protein
VLRHLKPASFTVLHTCRTAVMLISHPFCQGGGWEKAGLLSLRKIQLFIPYSPLSSDCGGDCEAESKTHGTATLLRGTLSAVVKSLSEKCLLHKYLLRSILAESVVQDISTFPAHTTLSFW